MPCVLMWDGKNLVVPEQMGSPAPHQLRGSNLDNLIELSGRVCYDSLSVPNSRNSVDYHKHIEEVGHRSVQEHAAFTVKVDRTDSCFFQGLLNRPGVFTRVKDNHSRLTVNIRSVKEWNRFGLPEIGDQLKDAAKTIAPLVMFDWESKGNCAKLVEPETEDERWISFYIHDISRSLSHELVRHGDFTAISQRSTRYVAEDESKWSWHPLVQKYYEENNSIEPLTTCEFLCKDAYKKFVAKFQSFLIERGVDKFSARKQARGAARGVLGNALSTDLVFSASLKQWKWMIELRGSRHADDEIRLLFVEVYRILNEKYPESFIGWATKESDYGIGQEIIPPNLY